jgi:hypothetical protein
MNSAVIKTVIAGRYRLLALTSVYILENSTPPYVNVSGIGIPFSDSDELTMMLNPTPMMMLNKPEC